MKLEMSYKRKFGNFTNMWKLIMFLINGSNNSKELKNLKTIKMEIHMQNLMGCSKK